MGVPPKQIGLRRLERRMRTQAAGSRAARRRPAGLRGARDESSRSATSPSQSVSMPASDAAPSASLNALRTRPTSTPPYPTPRIDKFAVRPPPRRPAVLSRKPRSKPTGAVRRASARTCGTTQARP